MSGRGEPIRTKWRVSLTLRQLCADLIWPDCPFKSDRCAGAWPIPPDRWEGHRSCWAHSLICQHRLHTLWWRLRHDCTHCRSASKAIRLSESAGKSRATPPGYRVTQFKSILVGRLDSIIWLRVSLKSSQESLPLRYSNMLKIGQTISEYSSLTAFRQLLKMWRKRKDQIPVSCVLCILMWIVVLCCRPTTGSIPRAGKGERGELDNKQTFLT